MQRGTRFSGRRPLRSQAIDRHRRPREVLPNLEWPEETGLAAPKRSAAPGGASSRFDRNACWSQLGSNRRFLEHSQKFFFADDGNPQRPSFFKLRTGFFACDNKL